MVTATIGKEHYRTELVAANHHLIAVNGTNLGPAPGQFLMLSLASCTAITLRMYADRKKFLLDKIRIEVGAEKINNTTVFTRHIYLEGNLDSSQKERLLQIANACPVHKTLTNPIEVKTEMI